MTAALAKSGVGVGVGALAVALGMSTVSLLAQQLPSVVLEAGEVKDHPTGVYRYQTVELGRDANLVITGTTSIVAERMVFDERATISYKQRSSPADHTKTLTLLVADASGSGGVLAVDGSGGDGSDGIDGADGHPGKNGEGALFSRDCEEAQPGGRGQDGRRGANGEKGMDLSITLQNLSPAANLVLTSNGGDGGDGGDGGRGGAGGRGRTCNLQPRRGAAGGGGGNGGNGGNGGDAGSIGAHLTYVRGTPEAELERLRRLLTGNITVIPGRGGHPGTKGIGGDGGNGGKGEDWWIGRRGSDGPGAPGQDGEPGSEGRSGTTSRELMDHLEWIRRNRPIVDELFPR